MPLVAEKLHAALAAHRLVNLTGPLGVGKTRLAAGLTDAARVDLDRPGALTALDRALTDATPRLLVVDGVDGRHRRDALHEVFERLPQHGPNLLVVSRTPVTADPRWAHTGAVVVPLGPACDGRIAVQAAALDCETRALVIRLAGGIPLLADAARRALESGRSPAVPGAVADQVAGEVLERLGRELPGRRWQHSLRQLATVRSGDERLLRGGPDHFSSFASLSLVRRGPLGLEIAEPYRTVFELAYQWRKPEAHRATRTRARAYRLDTLAVTGEPGVRADLAEQGLFLSGDRLLRKELFPARDCSVLIRRAHAQDADDIGRLMRAWAVHSGFDRRRCDQLTERWAGDDITAFHMAHDAYGKVIGLAGLMPTGPRAADSLEPLLQQHSQALQQGGLFLGAAHCPDPAVRAHVLRHILRTAVEGGRLIVSTANPDYQTLVRSLGFTIHGGISDDFYRCGRPPEVSSHDFAPDRLPSWLGRLCDGPQNSVGALAPGPRLAPKELRILLDYTSGMTLKSAARRSGVTLNTAKDYIKRIKTKYRLAGRPAYTKIDLAQRVREDGLDGL
ncbi:hypothetical protein ACFZAV_27650 [Streptomyces sp. NPDC008343]|uniref:helix-turn-helix transcriptional regulator n=1 Tax=Streptomyces sp. NPDC008343 TaxID=3364828 RepID=UPI0036EE8888